MSEVILLRHGHSKANDWRIFGTDTSLSSKGVMQVLDACKDYEGVAFDKVYCSQQLRTLQTATWLFSKPIPKDRQLAEFDEINFGDIEGKSNTETGVEGFKNQYTDDFISFMEECHGDDPYERADIAIKKMQDIADEMVEFPQAYPKGRVFIVTSDTLMRCIILTLKNGHEWRKISDETPFDNLNYIVFEYDDEAESDDKNTLSNINSVYEKSPVVFS